MAIRFVVREARPADLDALFALAEGRHFINLPHDRDHLRQKIEISRASFRGRLADPKRAEYLFALHDLSKDAAVGSSAIIAHHGTPEAPHIYFRTKKVEHYSRTLHAGFIHTTLSLEFMEDGPTELGGLVLDAAYRGKPERLGKLLSYVRFGYLAARRDRFRPRLLAEMAAPIASDGTNHLWEAIGRPFTNMEYAEADALSRENKEFIEALFPRSPIYIALLPAAARETIGKVARETEPAKAMLEAAGLRFGGMIDPFDGGPHLWAATDEVRPVKGTRALPLDDRAMAEASAEPPAIVSFVPAEPADDADAFRAVRSAYALEAGRIRLPKETIGALEVRAGETVQITPL